MRCLALLPLLTLVAAAPADERRFLVAGFDRLRVEGLVEVEVVAGQPAASASGDRRTLEALTVNVDAGTMVVRPGREGTGVPKVRIAVPALRGVLVNGAARVRVAEARGARVALSVNGAGTLEIGAVAAEDLIVALTGGGTIALAGKADRARVQSYGSGSIDAARLTAGEASLVSQSSGDLSIAVRRLARASALGVGAVRVTGSPECQVSGTGPVSCGAARN